jgi:hypothetical protein
VSRTNKYFNANFQACPELARLSEIPNNYLVDLRNRLMTCGCTELLSFTNLESDSLPFWLFPLSDQQHTKSSPDGRQPEFPLWSIRLTLSCCWCRYIKTECIVDIWRSPRIKGKGQFRREKLKMAQQKPLTILPVFMSLYHGKAKATCIWTPILISAQDINTPS